MSQRASGYERQQHEHYPTPPWVIDALAEHVVMAGRTVWEPACGTGLMAEALKAQGALVCATDIHDHGYRPMSSLLDFTSSQSSPLVHYDGIVTNPPYGDRASLAEAFIERGLERIADYGFLALLLPVDFDSAKTRTQFFAECRAFAGKIILTKRIKWFESADKKAGPSQNHAWFLWQNTWIGGAQYPVTRYAPTVRA